MARGGKKGKRGGGRGGRKDDGRSDLLEKADMNNDRFFAYYKAQNIVPEDEWDAFVESLRQHLPTTFRVAGSREIAKTLNATIQNVHVPSLSDVTFEGQRIAAPAQIAWYPDGLAWHFTVPKKVLRRSPEFKKFHSFLVFETEVGNVSRQEAVSMLPPLFLDVEPHHKCMDMCAAPGSKTAQILEALHAHDTTTASTIPRGLLVANDSDNKRTHLLIHQSARLPSPALLVTNLDASNYPVIRVPVETQNAKAAAPKLTPLLFDRILCDVPCSGDGTIRKNMGIWKSWAPMDGNGLHGLQLRILQRAMQMLAENGRIVYSTCSLNPVENEAVIVQALLSNPEFHLLATQHLPALIRRPGLTTWYPTTERSCTRVFESHDEFMASDVDSSMKTRITRGHWPPEGKEAEGLHLERCIRIYPHLQDTGGFFVAVLERRPKTPASTTPTTATTATTSTTSTTTSTDPDRERKRARTDAQLHAHELDESSHAQPAHDVDGDAANGADDEGERERKRARVDEGEEGAMAVEDAIETAGVDVEPIDADLDVENTKTDTDGDEVIPTMSSTPALAPVVIQAKETRVRAQRNTTSSADGGGFKENPYTFLAPNDPVLVACLKRLDISPAFPVANVLVRTPNPDAQAARALYLVNDAAKAVIAHNSYARLRLTAAGVKVFARQEGARGPPVGSTPASAAISTQETKEAQKEKADSQAQFRILSEGLPIVLPFVTPGTIMAGDARALRVLVESYYPLCAAFEGEFRAAVEARDSGSHIVRFPLGNFDGVNLTHDLVLPIWKSNVSVTLMIDKKAKSALSLRLFGADITTAGKDAQASQLQKELAQNKTPEHTQQNQPTASEAAMEAEEAVEEDEAAAPIDAEIEVDVAEDIPAAE